MTGTGTAALGFSPHSGWAVAVAVGEVEGGFRVLARERVELADPRDPGSRQPYHAVEGLSIGEAAGRLARYAGTAELMAVEAVRRVVEQLGPGGERAVGVGILASAGRKGRSLAETLASHALIHTADGEHFRDAIAGAAGRCGLAVVRVPARELESQVAAATGRRVETLPALLKAAGRELGPPWGSDQKSAALVAWLVLARSGGRGRRSGG